MAGDGYRSRFRNHVHGRPIYVKKLQPNGAIRLVEMGLEEFGPIDRVGVEALKNYKGDNIFLLELENETTKQRAYMELPLKFGDITPILDDMGITERTLVNWKAKARVAASGGFFKKNKINGCRKEVPREKHVEVSQYKATCAVWKFPDKIAGSGSDYSGLEKLEEEGVNCNSTQAVGSSSVMCFPENEWKQLPIRTGDSSKISDMGLSDLTLGGRNDRALTVVSSTCGNDNLKRHGEVSRSKTTCAEGTKLPNRVADLESQVSGLENDLKKLKQQLDFLVERAAESNKKSSKALNLDEEEAIDSEDHVSLFESEPEELMIQKSVESAIPDWFVNKIKELEAELKRLNGQLELRNFFADMLPTSNNNGNFLNKSLSMDGDGDDLIRKKNRNVLKRFGVSWKKPLKKFLQKIRMMIC